MTPPGTMSLRERMKMFEDKNKSDRVVPRETVGQTERASDIRSKISTWGKPSNNSNNNSLQVPGLTFLIRFPEIRKIGHIFV